MSYAFVFLFGVWAGLILSRETKRKEGASR